MKVFGKAWRLLSVERTGEMWRNRAVLVVLAWFSSHWLDSGCCHCYYCEGTDINGSGAVDFYDFAVFANNWLWEE